MKKAALYFICFLIVLICVYIFIVRALNKKQADDYRIFDSTAISGRIRSSSPSQGEEKFYIDHSNQMYRFKQVLTATNDLDFGTVAETGDSVFKASFSDTLYLIKKDGSATFRFNFQRTP